MCGTHTYMTSQTCKVGQKQEKTRHLPPPKNAELSSLVMTSMRQVISCFENPVLIMLIGNVSIRAKTTCGLKFEGKIRTDIVNCNSNKFSKKQKKQRK